MQRKGSKGQPSTGQHGRQQFQDANNTVQHVLPKIVRPKKHAARAQSSYRIRDGKLLLNNSKRS